MENKKILVISQNYYPEQFRINDICKSLVLMGCDVTVLTGLPNYPEGIIYDGYKSKEKRVEVVDGVKIIRVYERPRGRGGAINLFLNYYSFVFSSCKAIKKLDKDFDIVLINQLSPVMQAYAGLKYKKKFGTKTLLYCLDLWPASLSAGGVKQGGFIYKFFKKVSKKIYKSVDRICLTSRSFKDYFVSEFDFNENELVYLPQYSEDIFNTSKTSEKKIFNSQKINLVFAGNVGKMQSVETIIKTAKEIENECSDVMFHIIGNGSALDECKKLAEGLNNVVFYGRKNLEEMPIYYAEADAMLVSLKKDDLVSKTLPGKVQTYMSAGKPIIASGDNELSDIVKEANCGYASPAEDIETLKTNIIKFVNDENKLAYGENAKKYYDENFTKEKFFNKLIRIMEEE